MHISTGLFEGKEIKDSADGQVASTRLLTIKESVFEIIGTRVHDAAVLDINDKNGMYGIEAISKGAAATQFINLHDDEKTLIAENLKIVGLNPKNFLIETSPDEYLNQDTQVRYDIIFFDAQDKHCLDQLPDVLSLLHEKGIAVVIYPQNEECQLDMAPEGFEILECRDVETDKIAVIIKKSTIEK